MPAKRGGVITPAEARLMMADASTMKVALAWLQIEAGDRVDDPRMRNPNQTDVARGLRKLSDAEWDEIRIIIKKLVAAAAARQDTAS
jgi:hypothetical protein